MLEIKVLTLFPDMVRTVLETSILGRAAKQGQVHYEVTDIRDFAVDKHRTVDDSPYGGGAGMIMMAPCVVEAVESVQRCDDSPVLLTSPQGEKLNEALTLALLAEAETAGEIIIVCGHYKGVDERVRQLLNLREVSIGDYVLSGGELPALVIVDAMVRRIEGVLHDATSADCDSFTDERDGGLDCPWYTKPPVYRDLSVPEVLLTGHHANIDSWRRDQAHARTRALRPDLLRGAVTDAAAGRESAPD